MSKQKVQRCNIKFGTDGDISYTDIHSGELCAFVPASCEYVDDKRTKPPFLQIIPCPYCGVIYETGEGGHDNLLHVDHRLGQEVKNVPIFSDVINIPAYSTEIKTE